jgi:hypothetical protein
MPKRSDQEYQLRKKYGLTMDDYEWLLTVNNGGCHFCGGIQQATLVVDHDHLNRRIRGLLCYRCNAALNKIFDDPILIENAIRYANSRR